MACEECSGLHETIRRLQSELKRIEASRQNALIEIKRLRKQLSELVLFVEKLEDLGGKEV